MTKGERTTVKNLKTSCHYNSSKSQSKWTKDTNNIVSATNAGRGDMNFETRTNTMREKNCHKRKKEKIIVVAVVEENGFLTKEEDSAKKRDGEDFKQV